MSGKEVCYGEIAFTFFKEICRLQEVIQNQDSQIKSQEEGLKKLEPLKRTNQQQLINDKIQENTKLQLQVKESAEKINSLNYELGKTQKELEKMKKQKEENEQFYQAQLYSLKESNVPVEGGDTNALLSQMKQEKDELTKALAKKQEILDYYKSLVST